MAFQVDQACYATAQQAAQASASKLVGAVVEHGGNAYVINVAATADASITYAFQPVASGAAFQLVAPYSAQPCNLLGVEDGLAMGWMVAGVWLGVYALMFIGRVLWKGDSNDGDNT